MIYHILFISLINKVQVKRISAVTVARGQITEDNKARIKALVWRYCRKPKGTDKRVSNFMSKAALLTSFSLFSARKEPAWSSPGPLVIRS